MEFMKSQDFFTKDHTLASKTLSQWFLPQKNSHKGQNGKCLIIGGSRLFHSPVLWSAEVASHFVDMVHFASTKENNEIVQQLRKVFRNGITIDLVDLPSYIEEDGSILIGPGMMRLEEKSTLPKNITFEDILNTEPEGKRTQYLTYYTLVSYPDKPFVLDAGSLQMLNPEWLLQRKAPTILLPHQQEFYRVFNIRVSELTQGEKIQVVKEMAKKYNCIIMLKAIVDIVSDGVDVFCIHGGNQGLTKGGTGDVLAGLVVSFLAKNSAITATIVASYLLKKSAEDLFDTHGYWYNVSELINQIPKTFTNFTHEIINS